MPNILLIITSVTYVAVLTIYGLYIALILKNPKRKEYVKLINQALKKFLPLESLPNVTILVPTYNEEAVISKKLQNIADLNYPIEKTEVLLVDDCSTDRTCEIAQRMFKKLGLHGKITRNNERVGVNYSYNVGVPNAMSDLILMTGADTTIEVDALEKALKIMSSIENVGGITGIMAPVMEKSTTATLIEKNYRSSYEQMSIAESAIHSTFPGGGGFYLIKKTCFSPISIDRGSTDANISFSLIRNGFRHIYVPLVLSYETISLKLKDQIRQKLRRATRLIQSTLMNKDMFFRKEFQEFGMMIFPLHFAILNICPFLTFLGLISTFLAIRSFSVVLASSLIFVFFVFLYLGVRTTIRPLDFASSLLIQQFYLLLGLFFVGKKMSTWKQVQRKSTGALEDRTVAESK